MDKKLLKNALIVLLATICALSVFKYISSVREKYELLSKLQQTEGRISSLESEKQSLSQELDKEKSIQKKLELEKAELKNYLRAGKRRINGLFSDYDEKEALIADLNSKISLLNQENASLADEKKRIIREKEDLELKLSSIQELKKAMRELKKQARKVHKQILNKIDQEKMAEGNKGFLIKDGQSINPSKVKIEVIPAYKKE